MGKKLRVLKISNKWVPRIPSYEDECTQCLFDEINSSAVLSEFVRRVVPQTTKYDWLRSQRVMTESARLTVAGVLLYADCPQAILPKRSAVQILVYHTDEAEGSRETLEDGFPVSVEGCACRLISNTVAKVEEIIEPDAYPEVALHEIITNAVLHRDYSIKEDIQVRIFTNRIEVESPGRLPGHITVENILDEQFSRNPKLVRLISKFPEAPNKDVGEGLNTAFSAMVQMHLQRPVIRETDYSVVVTLKQERLADEESVIMEYLAAHDSISNAIARKLTGITDANLMKKTFYRLKDSHQIQIVEGTKGSATLWESTEKDPELKKSEEQMSMF